MKTIVISIFILMPVCLYGQIKLSPFRIGIIVRDVARASRWYEDNLEFKVYKKMDFPEYDSLKIHYLKQGNFEIELVEKSTSFSIKTLRPNYNANQEPLEGFTKVVFLVKDIHKTFEKLHLGGVKEILGITHDKEFDVDFFIIEDLDGNMLQFINTKK